MTEVEFTQKAAALMLKMRVEHPDMVLLIDDSSCCSNSSIIARESRPSWPVTLISVNSGVKVYVNPVLERSLKADRIIIDALDFADDSFSLETDYGGRLVMSVVSIKH